MFVNINECLDTNTESIHLISFSQYKYHMYSQLQRDYIKQYNYDVLDFFKLVKI